MAKISLSRLRGAGKERLEDADRRLRRFPDASASQAETSQEKSDDAVAAQSRTRSAAEAVVQLGQICRREGWTLGVAESLTGGALASTIVDVPGASDFFRGGVVSYQYGAKSMVLGVDADYLAEHGAVNAVVAEQMARGVAQVLHVDLALATTGVAGPGPADGCDAGTVWLGAVVNNQTYSRMVQLEGDRPAVRREAVSAALEFLMELVSRLSGNVQIDVQS